MAATAVAVGMDMPSKDMPVLAMLRVDTLVSVLAVHVVISSRGLRVATRALRAVHAIGMAVGTGEAVTGEAIIGILPMDILASAIMAGVTVIHLTDITVTPIIIATETIPISTDTGPTRA